MKKLAIILLTITSSAFAQDVITEEIQITNNDISINELNDLTNGTLNKSESVTLQEPIMTDDLEKMYQDVQAQSENLEINNEENAQNLEEYQDKVGVSYDTSNTSDSCGIWMCLPMGFPGAECQAPHREFHRRVAKGSSPLPSLSSCMDNQTASNSTLSSKDGVAAFIPKHKVRDKCIKYTMTTASIYGGPQQICAEYSYKWVEDSYIRGAVCIHGEHGTTKPKGCTKTVNWVEVLDNNEKVGSTYYW